MKILFFLVFFHLFITYSIYCQDKHRLFSEVLNAHVKNGSVNYIELCKDSNFYDYIDQLTNTDPYGLDSEQEKFVYWVNAYNAWTLKVVCDNYPIKSIIDLHRGGAVLSVIFKTTVWDEKVVRVNEESISLGFIEHNILRPVYKDPRVHFALVCAAKGCPPLRNEAYESGIIDFQLNDQGKNFLADKSKNRFDTERKIAFISPIFGWFKNDFGKNRKEIIDFIADFTPSQIKDYLKNNKEEWRMRYTNYDWSLNE